MYTILRTPQTCELRLQVSLEQIRCLWELSYRPPAVNPPVQSMKRASDFPGKNIGVGYHVLLQGIFPTQKTEPTFPAWQRLRKWKWARLLCVSGWHRKPERDKGETKDAGPGTSCFLLLSSASRPHLTSRGCAQEPPTYHHYVIPAHWPSSTGVHTGKKIQEPGRRPPEPMTRGSLVARPPAPRKGAQACSWTGWAGAVAGDVRAGAMARPHRAAWLPPALLLLWVPGCLSLSGPSRVTGIVGGSLSVKCQYREEFINNYKYWCKPPCVLLWKMMQTTESAREVRRDRMSIRDYPANLTFTVTLESLREEDAGTYWCGINVPLSIDPTFEVEVSVIPAPSASPTPRATRPTVTAKTSTITAKVSTVSFTTLATEGTTHSTSSQEEYEPMQNWGIHALLISLVLLLLLLGGISLLAWRMVQTRVKAGEKPQPPQGRSQAAEQTEPCYANLELQTRPLSGKPVHPTQVEVEYSTVGPPSGDLHYTSVIFDSRSQDSKANRIPSETPVYSVVKQT